MLKVLQESPGNFHLQILEVSKDHSPDTSHRQNGHKMGPGAEVVGGAGWHVHDQHKLRAEIPTALSAEA